MQRFAPVRVLAAAAMAGGLFAATSAIAAPDATVSFHGGHVAFIAGVNWGSGTLRYHGRSIPLKVSGVGVGSIGANSYSIEGDVYNLHNPADIVGTYTAIAASATAGAGAGVLDMTNAKGVEIKARSTSAGLALTLAPTGMNVEMK
jgi:hypothetical protein